MEWEMDFARIPLATGNSNHSNAVMRNFEQHRMMHLRNAIVALDFRHREKII
jgi:hypothetical protein